MTPKPTPKQKSNTEDSGDIDQKKFPNLAAEQDWDREQHIKQAIQAGMSRKQAERHADDELRNG